MDKDIIILGGGPGGYHAAIRGAQLGARVALIEKEQLGGTCLHWGCIPTKALYRSAEIVNTVKHMDSFGVHVDHYEIDVQRIQERKNHIVKQLAEGIDKLMESNHIEVFKGIGSIKDHNTVTVMLEDESQIDIKGKHMIIASGSKEWLPPIPGADTKGVLTSKEMLEFTEIPKQLTIIGGGVIGIEFATIFQAFGSQVTIVELLPTILQRMETDIVKRFEASLKKKGITIHKETKAVRIEKENGRYRVHVSGKKGEMKIESDQVLLAIGRRPRVEGLNLEGVGIDFCEKGIRVDGNFETNIKGIYAIGDVQGKNMLAHVASHQGVSVVEHIMGVKHDRGMNDVIPDCVFTFPELAGVGMTEEEAKEAGVKVQSSKFLFGGNGKALTLGELEGFVKVIANDRDEIIGVHIMGPHASDLIHEGALAVSNKMKISDIAGTIHAHPTLAETFAEAVLGLKNEAIHIAPAKR